MTRMRSPSYPSIPLFEAVEIAGKIHSKNRTSAISRDAAAKDMGYSGLTGRSLKVLAALIQYGLLEAAGKAQVRITKVAVDALHGLTDGIKRLALRTAGEGPRLFKELADRFPDGPPSSNALRSYLIQQNFADVAIGPAVTAFLQTYRQLQEAGVYESHGDDGDAAAESELQGEEVPPPPPPTPAGQQHGGYRVMEGERVVFSEEVGAASYLKLVASGDMNVDLLDALADFIKRQKRRLGLGENAETTA